MALHAETDTEHLDIGAFERAELERIGMPREIVMRHRLPHFGHLFASSGYAAGYYVYMWAEVLDADGFDAFVEAGDPFDPTVAERLRRYVYSTGGTLDPAHAYRLVPRPRSRRRADARAARSRRRAAAGLTRGRHSCERVAARDLRSRYPRQRRQQIEPGLALETARCARHLVERQRDRRAARG